MTAAKLSEVYDAFEYLAVEESASAAIDLQTGKVIVTLEDGDDDTAVLVRGADGHPAPHYKAIPSHIDFDLGRPLVMRFAATLSADHAAAIDACFARAGAYRRFKDYLTDNDLGERWFAFESAAKLDALRRWMQSEDIAFIDDVKAR